MAYHYETNNPFDFYWSREVMEELSDKFDDEDIITHYDIDSNKEGYIPSYRVYYIEFRTSNFEYKLKLNDEYTVWSLSQDGEYIGDFSSGIDTNSDGDEDTYTVDIDIKKLNDWIIDEIQKHEEKVGITNEANNLIDSVDDFEFEDKVKLIKYLMKKLDVSIEDLE
jgi:hypothetical protein